LAMLAGDIHDLEAALRRLPVPCAIVTLGGEGCVARAGKAILRQHAFAVDVVDTTAAGDTFCGALVAALARGDALAQALREASAASALACTAAGAQSSIPARAAVLGLVAASGRVRRDDGTLVTVGPAAQRAPGAALPEDMAPGWALSVRRSLRRTEATSAPPWRDACGLDRIPLRSPRT